MIALLCCLLLAPQQTESFDVVVYGGTSGGVAAAVEAASAGKKTVLLEPSRHLGGLSSGGLGATDIGNKAAIGGLARDFYRRVRRHYAGEDAWVHERREAFTGRGHRPGEDAAWTFEPHVAERIFEALVADAGVDVRREAWLELGADGAAMSSADPTRIASIRLTDGRVFAGRVFIDATYEGDLLAAAGVSYHVGRESNDTYGETLNGVQVRNARHHQFVVDVDPYVEPGNARSGLLPGIQPGGPGVEGSGDRKVQAYCFRLCATDAADNRRDWPRPEGYDRADYELLLRNFAAGDHRIPWHPVRMPNRKTDSNNNFAISTDAIGLNWDYPEASWAQRDRIVAAHRRYQQGLMWTLANDPAVPEKVRAHFRSFGLARDEFRDNNNWPHQLYIREARRMVSDVVMTELHCRGAETVDDPVGLGAYGMDSHNVQRYVNADGVVRNEGDVQVHGFSPYGVSYRAIRPRRTECANLLVPVCVSASHIAFGSIRMEPVFMVLGQSAAAAACLAIDLGVAVQDVPYERLRERLLELRQVLEWRGPVRKLIGLDPREIDGVVCDDSGAEIAGAWVASTSTKPFVGVSYRHDGNTDKGHMRATYRLAVGATGRYEVRLAYSAHANRASNVPVVVRSAGGEANKSIDQRRRAPIDGTWVSLGTYRFVAGRPAVVEVSNAGTDGYVVIDCVQLLRRD